MSARRVALSTGRPGVAIRITGLSRSSDDAHRAGDPVTSSNRPRAWRMLVGWSTQTPVGYGPTGSSGRQPKLGTGVRGTSTAAGPSGGAALGEGASVAPPPTLAPVEPAPPAASDSGECRPRRVDARHCARLPALIAELTSPDREIILLRIVAGLSITDVVAALGVTPAAIRLAQQQALSALQPTATANGPPPAARQRVVLLPHARTELIGNRPNNRRTGRATGMDQGDSPRQHWTGGTRASPLLPSGTTLSSP